MTEREPIVLGGKIFLSKASAETHLRRIKEAHGPGDYLFGEEARAVMDALQRHPACAEKVGLGIARVGLYENGGTRSGYGFGVERVDGTITRFSYHACFRAEWRSHDDRVFEALRQAVRQSILDWRDKTFAKYNERIVCPITSTLVDRKRCHVDHEPPVFPELVRSFLAIERLTISEVPIAISHGEQVEAVISSSELCRRWVRFQNHNCRLRILSIEGHQLHHEQRVERM